MSGKRVKIEKGSSCMRLKALKPAKTPKKPDRPPRGMQTRPVKRKRKGKTSGEKLQVSKG